jgi:hypothetical protein
MDIFEIETQIAALVAAMEGEGLGTVYDTVPAKPTFPCVIIAPAPEFITEDDETAYGERKLNLDVWIISTPSQSNSYLQKELYRKIAKAITQLETIDDWIFDTVSQPQPVEYNQSKCLAAIITGSIII